MSGLNISNAIILLYHGVTRERQSGIRNYSGKHIYFEEFDWQMSCLRKKCNVVSLRDLLKTLAEENSLSKNTVAVTFDDSFKNVYNNAFPILKKYKIPATLFLTSGFIGKNRIIWADLLEVILDNFKSADSIRKFIVLDKKLDLTSRNGKIVALERIKNYLKSVDEKTKNSFVESFVAEHKKFINRTNSENYQTLSWDNVKMMDRDDLIEIGSHTENHIVLSKIDLDVAEEEITLSKRNLEKNLGHRIDLFSYPEGQIDHYNQEVIKILKKVGFICGLSAQWGDNPLRVDLFHLKRIMVGFMGITFPFTRGLRLAVTNENR